MTVLTNVEERNRLDAICGTSPSDSREVGLFTASPTESGNETDEVGASEYSRQSISFGSASTSSDTTTATNDVLVEFPQAESNWGDITHWGIFDSGDTMIMYGQFDSSPITIDTNQVLKIESGQLEISLD